MIFFSFWLSKKAEKKPSTKRRQSKIITMFDYVVWQAFGNAIGETGDGIGLLCQAF